MLKEELQTKIINQILNAFDKKNSTINSSYKNFYKNNFDLKYFLENILKDNKQNNFVSNTINDIKKIFEKIINDFNIDFNPNTLNFEIFLKESLKLPVEEKDKEERTLNIKLDNGKMLRKYFKKEYDLEKVDKFIETLTKSISITNEKNITINNELIKDIIELNGKFKLHQNPEIQKLAEELEEHLKSKDKLGNLNVDYKPDYQ